MKQARIATGQPTNGKRRFEGDDRLDRSKKPAGHWEKFDYYDYYTAHDSNDSDAIIASGNTVFHSSSAIRKPLAYAKASITSTAALVVKDNVPPSQASTTDDIATQQDN